MNTTAVSRAPRRRFPVERRAAFIRALAVTVALIASAEPSFAFAADVADCPPLLDHTFNRLQNGEPQSLCQYRGKVLLVVNTASYCGYTRQYEGLEALYRRHKGRGLVVVGFPSNEFGSQEPGTNKEVAEFCRTTYGIDFPMYEKTTVSRLAANAFYAELITRSGVAPRWNFHKCLIDRAGRRVGSYPSRHRARLARASARARAAAGRDARFLTAARGNAAPRPPCPALR